MRPALGSEKSNPVWVFDKGVAMLQAVTATPKLIGLKEFMARPNLQGMAN